MKAVDAATGKLLWSYDPRVPGNIADKAAATRSTVVLPTGMARSILARSMAA